MNSSEVNALFLGPKGENTTFFKEMLAKAVDQHVAAMKYLWYVSEALAPMHVAS